MPRIAESLQQSGYGQQFGAGLGSLFKRLKDDQNQDEFNSLMQEAMNSLRNTYSSNPEVPNTIAPPSSTLGESLFKPPKLNEQKAPEPGFKDPTAFSEMFGTTNFSDLEKRGQQDKIKTEDQRRMQQQKVYADFMQKAMKMKDLDPNKLKLGLETLQMEASGNTPTRQKVELKSYKTDEDIYKVNDFGDIELVRPGVPDNTNSFKSLGSYTGEDGFEYVRLMGSDGTIKEVKSDKKVRPPKGTVINIPQPKSRRWDDFGAYINSIDYKEDPDTGKVTLNTPEERKIAREMVKNKGIGRMYPRCQNWYATEIKQKWGAENISMADFEKEIQESYAAGELSQDEAQELLDFNQFRPTLFDMLRDTARDVEGVEE